MVKHSFWGMIEEDWAGFSAEIVFNSNHFKSKDTEIFLGVEYDKEGEEIEACPDFEELEAFELSYKEFLERLDDLLVEIKAKTYERYLKYYASYYENRKDDPLFLKNNDEHFQYMNVIKYIRLLPEKTILLLFKYELDTEHGLEIRIIDNAISSIGGIAET